MKRRTFHNISKKIISVVLVLFLSAQTVEAAYQPWLSIPEFANREGYYVDRSEACKYLVATYQKITQRNLPPPIRNPFADVQITEQPYVIQAYDLGLVHGTSNHTFSPNRTLTKAEISTMVYALAKNTMSAATGAFSSPVGIKENMPSYANESVNFAFSRGLLERKPTGELGVNDNITLGELAIMLNKTVQAAPYYPAVSTSFPDKRAYLTFDDTTSKNTGQILDVLKKYDVKATFFISGKSDPTMLKRIQTEGHTIGNHSSSHNYAKIYASSGAFWDDFQIQQDYIQKAVGTAPIYFRFPGGSNNNPGVRNNMMTTLTKEAKLKGYLYLDWNVDSGDATGKNVPKDTIVNNVLTGAKNKKEAIILMHHTDTKNTTPQALPEIIEGLQQMGFVISPLTGNAYYPQYIR